MKTEHRSATWRPTVKPGGMFSLNTHSKRVRALVIAVVLVIFGICVHNVIASHSDASPQKSKAPIPVTVATADMESLPEEIKNIGNVEGYTTVNVIAQVGGQLMTANFKQGDYVQKGQLLFEIDPRTYQAAVDQAAANVDKDQAAIQVAQATANQAQANQQRDMASEQYAQTESHRYTHLVQQGAVSAEQSGQMNTNAATATATVKADQAAIQNALAGVKSNKATLEADRAILENAKVQLGYTKIYSPIDGRTGSLNVYPGNVVVANGANPLLSIIQTKPIYVTFSVPEEHLNQLRIAGGKGPLTVDALIEGKQSEKVTGTISFLDNTVDKTTGAIRLRGTFTNEDQRLWPGQFVDIVLTLPADKPMVTVATQAIQNSQQGQSVFVVKPDNTVSLVQVKVKRVYKDKSILSEGLNAGDVVVTDGQLLLTDGAAVTVKKSGP